MYASKRKTLLINKSKNYTMIEKTYAYKELADMYGLEPKSFKELMIEMGLMDKNGRATKYALKYGLLVDRSTHPGKNQVTQE